MKTVPVSKKRRYQQFCPVARGLNQVGDRWALLILRDLHMGPARFRDLQKGLTGIATNLLTTRLRDLLDSGLVHQREAEFSVRVYELTERGRATENLIMALIEFGSQLEVEPDLLPPGNLRLVGLPLKRLLQKVVEKDASLDLEWTVAQQAFSIRVRAGQLSVLMQAAPSASIGLSSALQPMLALLSGRLPADKFVADHLGIERGSGPQLDRVLGWIERSSGH